MSLLLLATLLPASPLHVARAHADDAAASPAATDAGSGSGGTASDGGATDPAASPAPVDLSNAEKPKDITPADVEKLEPKRWRLPQNPYGQTDFTAYTLEWGEVKLGVAALTVGIAPRVQLGTVPVLDVLRVPNANLKWDAVRAGPFDFAGLASVFVLPRADFQGTFAETGAMASVQILKPWSLHVAGLYDWISADGVIDLSTISPMLITDQTQSFNEGLKASDFSARANALTVRAATDVRFNRRDSLILYGSAMVWSSLDTQLTSDQQLPPIMALDSLLGKADKASGPVDIAKSYVVSLSYQASWKHVDLRLGYGFSATPFAWVLPATDLSYRFGGKTRVSETRMQKTWLQNLKDVQKARKAGKGAHPEGVSEKKKK